MPTSHLCTRVEERGAVDVGAAGGFVDVAEHMESRFHFVHALEQCEAPGAIVAVGQVENAVWWTVRDKHVRTGWDDAAHFAASSGSESMNAQSKKIGVHGLP